MPGRAKKLSPYGIVPGQAPTNPDGSRNYKRARGFGRVDGRTREAKLLKQTKADLLQLLGRAPDPLESALIAQIARLTLQIALLDEKFASGQASNYDQGVYLSWTRALAALNARFAKLLQTASGPRKTGRQSLGDKLRAAAAAEAQ